MDDQKSKMKVSEFKLTSPRIIIIGFALIILIGAVLLYFPVSAANGQRVSFLNALFTSTSAVCVTGLIVVDTPNAFSTFGEVVIMILIQIGGLGFMTFGVLMAIIMGKKIGLKERLLIQQSTNSSSPQGVVRLILGIFMIALIIESLGALILTLRWSNDLGAARAIYYGIFHSISAFNNAGFALWSDSLSRYVGDPTVNITIALLFILGGIGFTVVLDVYDKKSWSKLSLNTKVVLTTTVILIVLGVLVIFFIEIANPKTFGSLSLSEKLWASFFQGVVPRTAGFNTIDIASMMAASQFFMIFLMFVGASSGSTGGGIKTSTFAILVLAVLTIVRGREELQLFQRRIVQDLVLRALAVIIISLFVVLSSAFLLTLTEHKLQKDFLEILFEVTSAFGTVGMSMGLTYELSPIGKIIIMITMFIGRLGPLTLAFSFSQSIKKQPYRYVEEKLMIG
ncbi:TrkH family potassium uptake protein [Paenibacillus anseongensis]|nr:MULTISPECIES: TrkH family potassium uptake protein [Paenibacillus]